MESNNSNFKQLHAQEKIGSFYYKTQSESESKTDKEYGNVFDNEGESFLIPDFADIDAQEMNNDKDPDIFDYKTNNADIENNKDDINTIRKSTEHLGTNEQELADIIAKYTSGGKTTGGLGVLAENYKEMTGNDLYEELSDETTGAAQKYIDKVFETQNLSEVQNFDAHDSAQKLIDAFKGLGTDEAAVTEIIGNSAYSIKQMHNILFEYKNITGHELNDDIDKETSGFYNKLLSSKVSQNVTVLEDTPIKDENGKTIGTTKCTQYTDENGQVYVERYTNCDTKGKTTSSKDVVHEDNGDTVEYNRDENGQIISAKRTSKNGDVTYYKYENGQIVSAYCKCQNGDTIYYKYENGKRTLASRKNKEGVLLATYKYDKDGKNIECKKIYENGEPTKLERYKYDKNGKKIETSTYDMDNKLISVCKNTYDGKGRLASQNYINYDKAGKVESYKDISYSYHSNGKLKTLVCDVRDKNKRHKIRFKKECDEKGRVIKESNKAWDKAGNSEEKVNTYKYESSSRPNLITSTEQKVTKYDKNGALEYSASSKYSVKEYIRQIANDAGFNKDSINPNNPNDMIYYRMIYDDTTGVDIEAILAVMKKLNINFDTGAANNNSMTEIDNAERKMDKFGDGAKDELKKSLYAKIDLIGYDSSTLDNLCAFFAGFNDGNVDFKDYKNFTIKLKIERLKNAVNKALNSGKGEEIEKINTKINNLLKVDNDVYSVMDEIDSFDSSRNYYNSLSSEDLNNLKSIRKDFNPAKDTPKSLTESLLVQVNLIKKEIELAKQGQGHLDKAVALANRLFDFGTSEDDLEKAISKYEEQIRSLANTNDCDTFIAKYNALTGDSFSKDNLQDQLSCGYLINNICGSSMSDSEILKMASGSGKGLLSQEDINRAKGKDGKIDYGKLRTILAGALAEDFGAAKSSPGGTFRDYQDTVKGHRELFIDIMRTGVVAATSLIPGVNVGALTAMCAVAGGATQFGLTYWNSATSSDMRANPEEMKKKLWAAAISGTISGAFQFGAGKAGQAITGKFFADCGCVNIVSDAITNIGIKGVGQNVIQKGFNYFADNFDQFKKWSNGELSEDEAQKLFNGLFEDVKDGVTNGIVTGVFLCMISKFMPGDKIHAKAEEFFKKAESLGGIEGEVSLKRTEMIMSKLISKAATAFFKTGAKTMSRFICGDETDLNWVAGTSIKEIESQLLA